jgi:hypothetical protein
MGTQLCNSTVANLAPEHLLSERDFVIEPAIVGEPLLDRVG